MADLKCSTSDCTWNGQGACNNNRLMTQIRTGAASASLCTGPDCQGFNNKKS